MHGARSVCKRAACEQATCHQVTTPGNWNIEDEEAGSILPVASIAFQVGSQSAITYQTFRIRFASESTTGTGRHAVATMLPPCCHLIAGHSQ